MSPALLPKPAEAPEAPEDDVQLSLRDHLIELRKRLYPARPHYELIGASVTDPRTPIANRSV